MESLYFQDAAAALSDGLVQASAEALKTLLESKHLYQRVSINVDEIIAGVSGRMARNETRFDPFAAAMKKEGRLHPSPHRWAFDPSDLDSSLPLLSLVLRNIKVVCNSCKERETFASFWSEEMTNRVLLAASLGHGSSVNDTDPLFQVYVLAYQCQTCKEQPIVFLVRRQKWSLILVGRSPFADIQVPSFLPKTERHFYRDAVVAYQAGQTLAALFLLRTFIEQFGRRVLGIEGRIT